MTSQEIDAITDPLVLQKEQLKLQTAQFAAYTEELKAVALAREEAKRHNAALEAIFTKNSEIAAAQLAMWKQQATGFDASERGKVVQDVFTALVPKYMTPGTATDPATQLTDATKDANYLKVAVQQVMGVYDVLREPV